MAIKHNFFGYLLFSDAVGGIWQTNMIHYSFHLGILRNYWLDWGRDSLGQVVWAHLDLLEEVGATELLCYFLFLLTKVRRSMAVATPKTICFMKELPFPLTGSTENSSLVVKKLKKNNPPSPPPSPLPPSSCAEAAVHLLKENLNRDSVCLSSASTEMSDGASGRLL